MTALANNPLSAEVKRACLIIGCIGAAMAVLGGTLPISMGKQTIPSAEAWILGLAPTFVVFGLLLIALSYAMYRGLRWVRWPITLWFPTYFVAFVAVAGWKNFSITALDWLEALIITGLWLYGTWDIFRGKQVRAHLSRGRT